MSNNPQLLINPDYFETVLIYKCLTDEIYLSTVVEHLNPKYFKCKHKAVIIQIITDFYIKRGVIPTIPEIKSYLNTEPLKNSLKTVVAEFSDFSKKLNEEELYSNTEQFLKEKAVYNAITEIIENKKGLDAGQILQTMEKACSITLLSDIGFDYFNKIPEHIADINRVEQYIPSGWSWLDKKLGGGFLKDGRALYVFAGQTNIGKSIFLGNIAANVANQGKTVSIVTLEMPEQMYARRISSKITQVPMNEFSKSSEEVRLKLTTYRKEHIDSRLVIKEFPPSSITPIQLNSYYKKLLQTGIKPDLFVLDYLNLLTTSVGNNSYEKIKHVSEQVRALTYFYKAPLVSATQLNRGGVNKESPDVDNVSESMGLPATADFMASLWQEDEDAELGVIKMSLMKNRYGSNSGTCVMRINYPTLTLVEEGFSNETDTIVDTVKTLKILSD